MRNPFRRFALVAIALLMVATIVISDGATQPAEAQSIRRSASTSTLGRTRAASVRRLRYRVSRSAYRRRIAPALTAAAFGGDVWAALRHCESRSRYDINTGNGFYGAYQFLPSTWRGLGYPGMPHQAPPEVQDEAARKLQDRSGWGQWPVCSRRIGVR